MEMVIKFPLLIFDFEALPKFLLLLLALQIYVHTYIYNNKQK